MLEIKGGALFVLCGAWWPPHAFGFEHGIKNGQQLAGRRDQRDLGRSPGATQALIEGLEHGVITHCSDGTHVKHSA